MSRPPHIKHCLLAAIFAFYSLFSGCSETTEAKIGRLTYSDPRHGDQDVPVNTSVTLTFSEQLDPKNLNVLSDGSTCDEQHALALSNDAFSSCIPVELSVVEGSSYRKLAVQPITDLAPELSHQLRLTPRINFRHFGPLQETLIEFTTAALDEE